MDEALKQWLKENLKIKLSTEHFSSFGSGRGTYRIRVSLEVDGVEIDCDSDTISLG